MFCIECDRPVTPKENPWAEVIGFERKRESGGTNHVALRKRTGRIVCPECMVKMLAGMASGQQSLV